MALLVVELRSREMGVIVCMVLSVGVWLRTNINVSDWSGSIRWKFSRQPQRGAIGTEEAKNCLFLSARLT